jgi:hypothetical protein
MSDTTNPVSKAGIADYSFSQINDMLYKAMSVIAPVVPVTSYGSVNDWWICETYIDRVIVSWPDGKMYQVAYELDADGNTILADMAQWVEVKRETVYVAKEQAEGYIAKAADDEPLVFCAGGAFCDRDKEWVSGEFLGKIAKAVDAGDIPMTIDVWHVGFPSRSNLKPQAEPVIIGKIAKAAFENDHLVLLPEFNTSEDEATVRANADELGLSIYFNGAQKDADGAFRGDPNGKLSVAVMPKGFESYRYTAIN